MILQFSSKSSINKLSFLLIDMDQGLFFKEITIVSIYQARAISLNIMTQLLALACHQKKI